MDPAIEKLERALSDPAGLYVGSAVDADAYLADLTSDVRAHICTPFPVSATVMPPGFPAAEVGSVISGLCVAHRAGYWLIYQPEHDSFYCFWGSDSSNLGAHGVSGHPLYCWSA